MINHQHHQCLEFEEMVLQELPVLLLLVVVLFLFVSRVVVAQSLLLNQQDFLALLVHNLDLVNSSLQELDNYFPYNILILMLSY